MRSVRWSAPGARACQSLGPSQPARCHLATPLHWRQHQCRCQSRRLLPAPRAAGTHQLRSPQPRAAATSPKQDYLLRNRYKLKEEGRARKGQRLAFPAPTVAHATSRAVSQAGLPAKSMASSALAAFPAEPTALTNSGGQSSPVTGNHISSRHDLRPPYKRLPAWHELRPLPRLRTCLTCALVIGYSRRSRPLRSAPP